MASIRRFDAPVIKSIFTPDTWSIPDMNTPATIRLASDVRRITPHTIKKSTPGMIESPFGPPTPELLGLPPMMSSSPTKSSDPLAYGGAVSMPGGAAPTSSGMSMPGSVSVPGSAPEPYTGMVPIPKRKFSDPIMKLKPVYDKHTLAHYPGTRVDSTGRRVPMRTLDEMDALRRSKASKGLHPDYGRSIDYDTHGVLTFDYPYSLASIASPSWKGYGGMSTLDVYEAGKEAHAKAYRDKYAAYL